MLYSLSYHYLPPSELTIYSFIAIKPDGVQVR